MRYFFNVHDGIDNFDLAGIELEDETAVRLEAMRRFCALVDSSATRVWDGSDVRVEVLNSDRLLLFQLHAFASFSAAGRETVSFR